MANDFRHRGVDKGAESIGPGYTRIAFGASVGLVVLAAFMSAGQEHFWTVGHRGLGEGGFETVTSIATLAIAACALSASIVSRHSGELGAQAFRAAARARFAAMPDLSRPGRDPGKPLTAREFLAAEGASDPEAIEAALAGQIGPRYVPGDGTASLPLHLRCLVVCLTARPSEREMLVQAVSRAWDGPDADAKLRELCDPRIERCWLEVREILSRHDRYRTGMLALAERARARGQLVTARLHWLGREDPVLWQAICDLGRPTCHPVSLALLTHYRSEVQAGGPMNVDVSSATRTLIAEVEPVR